MIPTRETTDLYAEITGNVVDQELIQVRNDRAFGSPGIEAGGRVVLGTATTADVTVTDATGKVLLNQASIVANLDIDSQANGIKGPLKVTVANISNASHTLTVYWSVRK